LFKWSRGWNGLLQGLEVGDDIVDVARRAHAAEWHPVALHRGLWVHDVGPQIGLVPSQVGPAHRGGIAEVVTRSGLAADHAFEVWPERIRLVAVAGGAGRI